jgi:hypothetical protein
MAFLLYPRNMPTSPAVQDDHNEHEMPELGGTSRDIGVSLVKGAVAAIPFVGSFFGELIGIFIPRRWSRPQTS